MKDIQPSVPVSVSLKNGKLPPAKLTSAPSQNSIVHHSMNISDPPVTIQITAKPLQHEILQVFIDLGRNPTEALHKWNYTLPKKVNGSYGENFTITDSAYSITLTARAIRDALSGANGNSTNSTMKTADSGNTTSSGNITGLGTELDSTAISVGIKKKGKNYLINISAK